MTAAAAATTMAAAAGSGSSCCCAAAAATASADLRIAAQARGTAAEAIEISRRRQSPFFLSESLAEKPFSRYTVTDQPKKENCYE